MKVLVGIDIGTTNIKVNAFSREGKELFSASYKNKLIEINPGYDIDGDYIFKMVLKSLREIIARGYQPASLGISSLGETVLPIFNSQRSKREQDKSSRVRLAEQKNNNIDVIDNNKKITSKNKSTTRAMIWHDSRSRPQFEAFLNKITEEEFFLETGLWPDYIYSIFKLLWYYENKPELFQAADCWLPVNSYLVYRLTGRAVMDYSQASRTGGFNLQQKTWSRKIFSRLPFSSDVFPKLLDCGIKAGNIKVNIKEELKGELKRDLQARLATDLETEPATEMGRKLKKDQDTELERDLKSELRRELKKDQDTELERDLKSELRKELKKDLERSQKRKLERELKKKSEREEEVGEEKKYEKEREIEEEVEMEREEEKEKPEIDYEIPVSLAGHDHICGSYAVAGFRGDLLVDSMGTAEDILAIIDPDEVSRKELLARRVSIGLHVIPGKAYIYKAFGYSGAVINSLISLFFNKPFSEISAEDFARFNREAEKYQRSENLPKLLIAQNGDSPAENRYEIDNLNILNIPLDACRGRLFMAAVRYLAEKSRKYIQDIEETISRKYDVIAIGGSTKNNLLMSEKARILEGELYINDIEEAVTLGAALLGGVGAGCYQDYQSAVTAITREKHKV